MHQKGRPSRQIADGIGDELRAAPRDVQQKPHALSRRDWQLVPLVVCVMPLRNDASDQGRVSAARKFDQLRIKRHDSGGSAIRGKDVGCPCQKPDIAVEVTFELKKQRDPAGYEIKQFTERKNAIAGRPESYCPQLCRTQFGETSGTFGQTTKR